MTTTIRQHTFLPLLPRMYMHKYITTEKKNQYSQLYTKQKNYGWVSCLQNPFSPSQKVKTLLILSKIQIMYNRTLRCAKNSK